MHVPQNDQRFSHAKRAIIKAEHSVYIQYSTVCLYSWGSSFSTSEKLISTDTIGMNAQSCRVFTDMEPNSSLTYSFCNPIKGFSCLQPLPLLKVYYSSLFCKVYFQELIHHFTIPFFAIVTPLKSTELQQHETEVRQW